MADFTTIMDTRDVPQGRVVAVEIEGRKYIVGKTGDRFFVADVLCPHAGGSLATAEVHDDQLVCPVHRWPWDLTTGLTDPNTPACRLKLYRTEIRDSKIYADLSEPLPLDFGAL